MVTEAVRREIEWLRERDEALADSALAASAMVLAEELDDSSNSATSKSMCARALREALDRLRELSPPVVARDEIDDLRDRRANRRRAAAS